MRFIRILQPVLIVLIVHIIFTFFILRYYQWDISCLVHAGQTYVNEIEAPKELCLKDQGDGYDGQFNYRFALNPFSNQAVVHGISIDRPIYRYQRIFYPFVTWVFTGGNKLLVPIFFVILNLVAICGLTAVSAKYALDQGRNSHWSLTLGLYLGFLISYALDLSHSLEILLLFSSLFLVRKNDHWAVILLICAVLTRETALIFAAAILFIAIVQHWPRWYLYLLPVGVFIIWQIFLIWFWRDVPSLARGESLVFPMTGYLTSLRSSFLRGDYFNLSLLILFLILGLVGFFALRRSSTPIYIKLAWLLYSGMALMMSFDVWAKFNGFLRGLSEWYFLSFLIIFPLIKLPHKSGNKT